MAADARLWWRRRTSSCGARERWGGPCGRGLCSRRCEGQSRRRRPRGRAARCGRGSKTLTTSVRVSRQARRCHRPCFRPPRPQAASNGTPRRGSSARSSPSRSTALWLFSQRSAGRSGRLSRPDRFGSTSSVPLRWPARGSDGVAGKATEVKMQRRSSRRPDGCDRPAGGASRWESPAAQRGLATRRLCSSC